MHQAFGLRGKSKLFHLKNGHGFQPIRAVPALANWCMLWRLSFLWHQTAQQDSALFGVCSVVNAAPVTRCVYSHTGSQLPSILRNQRTQSWNARIGGGLVSPPGGHTYNLLITYSKVINQALSPASPAFRQACSHRLTGRGGRNGRAQASLLKGQEF